MQVFQPNDLICNRYKVIRKLGAGAMGSVYLCEDSVESGIKVALKVLVSDELDDQDVWAKGEYEALTRLRHPNLARVYNFGRIGDSKDYFIVSEFIKGVDLYSATEYLKYDELTDIIVQICRALEYIHSQGYVHFDIKPDNILVTRYKTIGLKEGSKVQYNEADLADGEKACAKPNVKLIDFGLAEKITGSFSFAIKGTLNYLAPEILNQKTPDRRADLYSLGVTLYQVVNRELPFYHEGMFGERTSVPLKTHDIFRAHMKNHPEFLKDLILRLLEENVEDRFQSAREVIHFINKHSGYHFDVETPETRASYFQASRLVGRRREMNILKDCLEQVFFPAAWREVRRVEPGEGDEDPGEEGAAAGEATPSSRHGEEGTAGDGASGEAPAAAVLVTGEMGAGKSRLLEEFQHHLKLRNFAYISGNCYEGNRKAYQPFIEVLRQLICNLGHDSEICSKYRPEILKLLPELAVGEEERREDGTRPDKEKQCFSERISQFLLEACAASPFVLAINNLHWVDEASLDLLENLLARIAELRKGGQPPAFLAVLSMRPEELYSDRLRDLLDSWREHGLSREIPVRRLKYSQIQELLCAVLNFTEMPEAFVAKLTECTGGNPLFVIETLKTLEDEGVIRNVGGTWSIKSANIERIDIPRRMDDLLGSRLEKLDPRKREILEVLAALDKPANPKAIQCLKRFADVPVLAELRNLEQTGITSKTFEGGKLHFQIAQPKVREIVYSRIPEEKRKRYHAELADFLLESYKGREDEILEEAAYHYQRSDRLEKAVEMAVQAGDHLKRIYANDRAYEYYLYVLERVEGDPDLFEVWTATHEKMGDLCTTMGRYEIADRSYGALLEPEVRSRLDPRRVVRVFLARGRVFEIQGDYDQALRCYKDASNFISTCDRKDLAGEKIRAFNSIGWVYVSTGKYEKAMAISLEALRVLEGAPEKMEHAMVYHTIGSANYYKGNFAEAVEYHRKSLQIRENLENIAEITTSLNSLASAHLAAAEYGEAAELLERALRASEETGDPYGRAVSLHHKARLFFAVGEAEKGWACLDESLSLSKLHNMRFLNTQNYIVRGKALLDRGEHGKAEGNYFRALTAFSKQANRWGLCTVLLRLSELHRLQGNVEEAKTAVAEARRYAGELGIHHLQVSGMVEEARILRELGEEGLAKALDLLEEAASLAERCRQPELIAEVHLELGETLVKARALKKAAEHYKRAEEKFNEVLESLPQAFRDTYRAARRVLFRNWKKSGGERKRAAPAAAGVPAADAPPAATEAGGAREAPPQPKLEERSLEKVNQLMAALLSGASLKGFLEDLLGSLLEVFGAEHAFALFVQGGSVIVEAEKAPEGKTGLDPEKALCLKLIGCTVASKAPYLLADVADDGEAARELESQGSAARSLLVAPFPIEGKWCGVLYLLNPRLPQGGDAGVFRIVAPFLNLASLAYRQLTPEAVPQAAAPR